jgi:TP901 family phage tail tape measure protein
MPGVVYKISGDNSQFRQDVNQSEHIAQGGFDRISAAGIAAWAAIGAAVIKVTKAGVDFIKDSVNVGMGFDKSMSQVAATMGTTVDQIGELTMFAQEMGATTAFSAQQAADGLNILAMSGLNATEMMQTLPEVLNLAASGGLDLATASKYVTGAVKGFGDSFEHASKYTDMIATGASKANTNVNQLGLALSDSAATASSYGQTAEGTTLALLRLAEQNVTGAEAATALNRAMMDLYTPTTAAKKAMDSLGVSAYDSTGKARPLNDVIDDLTVAMDGMSDAEKNATKNAIFSTFGLQAYNKMVVSSKQKVGEFEKALDGATGSAKKMADTQLDNLAGDITLAKSAAEGFKIAISNGLTPAIRSFVQKGANELGKLKSAFENAGWSGLARQLALSLKSMASEVGKALPEIGHAIVSFFGTLGSEIANAIVNNADGIMLGAKKLIDKLGDSLKNGAPELGKKVGDLIASTLANAPQLIKSANEFVKNLGIAIIKALPGIAEGIYNGFKGMFSIPLSEEVLSARSELETLKSTFSELRAEMDVTETISNIDAKYKLAEGWITTFETLSKKTSLTKTEQLELNAAIEGLNSLLPSTQQLVKTETGEWNMNTEAIKLNIKAQKDRAKAEAYIKATQKALEAMVEAEIAMKSHADLAEIYEANYNGLVKTSKLVKDARDTVLEFMDDVRSKGKVIMAQDLPAPARKYAEQWNITGPLTVEQLEAISRALGDQAKQLDTDAENAKRMGESHKEAAETAKAAYEDAKRTYEAADGTAKQLQHDAEEAEKAAYAAQQAYLNALESAREAARERGHAMAMAAKEAAHADLSGEGMNAGESFARGIESAIKDVTAASNRLGAAAETGVKRFLVIKSPSRVTRKLGEYVTEGFALGIEDNTQIDKVEAASAKVASAGASALTSSIGSSINSTPVTGTETGKIDMIITLLTTYLPGMGGDIVLDTGALVGHTIGQTDAELGQLQKRRARYE